MSTKNQRSRGGCINCKKSKIKCDEKKPMCGQCAKKGRDDCAYALVLQWGGRPYKNAKKGKKVLPNTTCIDGVLTLSKKIKKSSGVRAKAVSPTSINISYDQPLRLSEINKIEEIDPIELTSGPSLGSVFGESPRLLELCDNTFPLDSLSIRSLSPVYPSAEMLGSSPYYSDLFQFFLKETSRLLVPAPNYMFHTNPFHTLIAQMAMHSPTLMSLILAFAANHRYKMIAYQERLTFPALDEISGYDNADGALADQLLSQTFSQLLSQLTNAEQRRSNTTLATILMLAGFDIFFSDTRNKWRAHIFGAWGLIMDRLRSRSKKKLLIPLVTEGLDPDTFLCHWFSYLNIIASLSSANRATMHNTPLKLSYELASEADSSSTYNIRRQMKDIDYFTGLETKVLSLLADVAALIDRKESVEEHDDMHELMLNALELDHEIVTYLRESELERDKICAQLLQDVTDPSISLQYQSYKTMRATNMIFGLTGVLQLKRRVIGIPQRSTIVKDLLLQISELVQNEIPLNSSAESCITFCLFCCGCELVADEYITLRKIYVDHIEVLLRKGMTSAQQAKTIMEECWEGRKYWWDILKERNLDLAFAI